MGVLVQLLQKALPARVKQAVKAEIVRRFTIPSMDWSLANLRRLGFRPGTILDIGAFEGEWTRMARAVFPEATILMLEAQEGKRDTLQAVGQSVGRARCRIALLGAEPKEAVPFYRYDATTASSVLRGSRPTPFTTCTCRMETLDSILALEGVTRPDLIKLDVQGYELEILKGGAQAMAQAQAILLEVSLIELYQGVPLLHEVVSFLAAHRYRAYDICGLIRRPLDQALCQADMLFLKKDSPLFQDKSWG